MMDLNRILQQWKEKLEHPWDDPILIIGTTILIIILIAATQLR